MTRQGIEPKSTDCEADALPLDHRAGQNFCAFSKRGGTSPPNSLLTVPVQLQGMRFKTSKM